MKAKTLKTLLIIETTVIVLILMWVFYEVARSNNKTELLREVSPDGKYVLLIQELGKPSPVFSGSFYTIDRIKVVLFENNNKEHYSAMFNADIPTDFVSVQYEIGWLEDGVQIVLSGFETQRYILPFKTLEDP